MGYHACGRSADCDMADDTLPPKDTGPLREQTQIARRVLQQAPLAPNQTVILSRGPQLFAHRGDLKLAEAQDVAVYVDRTWQERGQSVRVQFMRLPALPAPCLLYTVRLGDNRFLTVADAQSTELGPLARLAEQLAALLERTGLNGYNTGQSAA